MCIKDPAGARELLSWPRGRPGHGVEPKGHFETFRDGSHRYRPDRRWRFLSSCAGVPAGARRQHAAFQQHGTTAGGITYSAIRDNLLLTQQSAKVVGPRPAKLAGGNPGRIRCVRHGRSERKPALPWTGRYRNPVSSLVMAGKHSGQDEDAGQSFVEGSLAVVQSPLRAQAPVVAMGQRRTHPGGTLRHRAPRGARAKPRGGPDGDIEADQRPRAGSPAGRQCRSTA